MGKGVPIVAAPGQQAVVDVLDTRDDVAVSRISVSFDVEGRWRMKVEPLNSPVPEPGDLERQVAG